MKKTLAMILMVMVILTTAQVCCAEVYLGYARTPQDKIGLGFELIGEGISDAWDNFTEDAGEMAHNVTENVGAAASTAGEKISDVWNSGVKKVEAIDWKFWD